MPWNGIADFVERRNRNKVTDQQTNFDQLLKVAGLAKDVWTQMREQDKYKPGSDYMNAMKTMTVDWPSEAAKQQGQQKLDYDKSWLDYQNLHPGDPADVTSAKWFQTPEGQQALQAGYTREDAVRSSEHQNRLSEIAAGRGQDQNWMSVKDAHDLAISDAAAAFHMPIDTSGNPSWDPSVDKEKVRAMLHDYAQFVDPAQKQAFVSLMDKWVDTGATAPAVTSQGAGKVDYPTAISNIVSKAQEITSRRGNTQGNPLTQGAGQINNLQAQSDLEGQLQDVGASILMDPGVSSQDKTTVQNVINQLKPVTLVDVNTLMALKDKILSILQAKARAGSGRAAGGL